MPDEEDVLAVGVFIDQLLKVGIGSGEVESWAGLDLDLVAQFVADELSSLECALEGTGENHIHLSIKGGQCAAHRCALANAVLIERTLIVLFGIRFALAGTGVAKKIDEHDQLALVYD